MSFLRVYRTDVDWNADNGQFTLLQYAAHQVHCTMHMYTIVYIYAWTKYL